MKLNPIQVNLIVHNEIAKGGEWLRAARQWMQSNIRDGDTLEWGSGQPVQVPFCKLEELAKKVAVAAVVHERLTRQDKPVYPLIDFFNDLLTCDSWLLIQEKIERATDLNELFLSSKEHPSHQHWLNLKAANDKGNLRLLINEWMARIYTSQAQELRCILAVKGSQNG